ncbi:MAG TPA: bifunctional 4-hydroxy-2-oxoglutarate aldolase/2-dehydro-3-deoxy-phosphogluconate aldolase [Solirubrobacteraceae bacterium]
MPARPPLTPQLQESGVVAILRGSTDRHLEGVSRMLGEAGVTCLELTLTTPGAVAALARVRAELDDGVALGMGSVLTADQAAACLEAGADFLVSPGVCAEVAVYAVEHGVPCYPGGWTPTEVLEAWGLGVPAVKLFPAASGGPRHLKDVRAPLPHIPLVPTGGVALDQIAAYMAAGAVAVGLGGPLVGDALEGGSLGALHERAQAALAAVATGREGR